jgi:hypothetical protein
MKLKFGKSEPAFEKPKVLQHGISQKRLNELAEDWDAMYQALMPFAQLYEQANRPEGVVVKTDWQDVWKKNDLPPAPGPITNARWVSARDDWYVQTDSGWYWLRGKVWVKVPQGPL